MSDKIVLTGISAIGYHGVFAEERENGQRFIVDATLELDLTLPGSNDHLINTVDYSKVAQFIHDCITGEPVSLLEKLAESIASGILANYSLVQKVTITLHKPQAPIAVPFTDVAIVIERHR